MSWLARLTWAVTGATLTLYLLIVGWSLPLITADADGLPAFDLRPTGYDLQAARAFLAALGEVGMAQYLGPQALLDRFFPPLFSAMCVLSVWQLWPRRWALVLTVPAVLATWFDWRENAAVAAILRHGAEALDAETVAAAARLTQLKSACVTLAVCAVLTGAIAALWRARREARAAPSDSRTNGAKRT